MPIAFERGMPVTHFASAALGQALASDSTRPLEAYAATRGRVARQVVLLTNGLTRLALMQRQLRTLRNLTLSTLNPLVNRRFAWQLSGLAYR
jgi:hypothetical protein